MRSEPACKESTSDRPDATTPSDGAHPDGPQHCSRQKAVGSAHAGQDTIFSWVEILGRPLRRLWTNCPVSRYRLSILLMVPCGTPSRQLMTSCVRPSPRQPIASLTNSGGRWRTIFLSRNTDSGVAAEGQYDTGGEQLEIGVFYRKPLKSHF